MRTAEVTRKTAETDISLKLNLDGSGKSKINTGCGFLDHMLILFARHAGFDLELKCLGDTFVDYHHTTEDIGICLGKVVKEALGDKRGIVRYGSMLLPMDEALILTAVDISGRGMLRFGLDLPTEKVGDFDTELVKEFFLAFTRESDITVHIRQLDGENSHHIIEAMFKGLGRALRQAVAIDPARAGEAASSKGTLA